MQVVIKKREFRYNGTKLGNDPDPNLPIERVRSYFGATIDPKLNTSSYTTKEEGDLLVIEFTNSIGTKG